MIETAALAAYLRGQGFAGALALEPIGGGQSNPTFFAEMGGRRFVLRKQPAGPLLPSAHAIDREYRALGALAGSDVPVPAPLHYCADATVLGTPFYLMERIEGRVFHDCALPDAPAGERRAMYAALARTLAALHAIDPARVGLGDFGRPTDYFARQIARWSRQREGAADPAIDRLQAWLAAHVPAEQASGIVHGDYRVGNVIFAPGRPEVVAVLDWELATLGHPLADVAHCCIAWQAAPAEYGGLRGLDLDALGLPTQAAFVAEYEAASSHGMRLNSFHLAFALYRFAAIFEGIAMRARRGNANDPDAAAQGTLASAFARRGLALLDA